MADAEQIKQEIRDWYADPEEPLVAAFTAFIHQLSFRRSEVTLPSGIAKMWGLEEERVVFWVGEELFCAHKDRDLTTDGVTFYTQDWQADDLYKVETVNKVVTEVVPSDSPSAH
jgi:hypothetical protein